MVKIAPSVLASDFARLGEEAAAMEAAGADLLHLDVMDGHFVPNISFGPPVIQKLRSATGLCFDVHLMITHPLRYITAFADAGADILTIHLECGDDIAETLAEIRKRKVRPGIVLKPATPAEAAFPWLDQVEMVLVMTVEPGFGGQSFLADQMPKLQAIRAEADRRNLSLDLAVDGGIDRNTAPIATAHGANVLVAGSALFGAADYRDAVAALRRAASAR